SLYCAPAPGCDPTPVGTVSPRPCAAPTAVVDIRRRLPARPGGAYHGDPEQEVSTEGRTGVPRAPRCRERRGYLQAGAFVPEVVLERPGLVQELHRDFVHAGSDVVEAFTYYAHRAKLRIVGREKDLETINRTALRIAKQVARETGTLLAGNICNTSV